MITTEKRKELFKGHEGIYVKNKFARVVKDYEREWLEYTLPAGTIVPVEIYTVQPDVIELDGNRFLVHAKDAEFFEVIE